MLAVWHRRSCLERLNLDWMSVQHRVVLSLLSSSPLLMVQATLLSSATDDQQPNHLDHLSTRSNLLVLHIVEQKFSLRTELVENETVRLNTFAEFIRLAANQYRHVVRLSDECDLCGSNLTHHIAVTQQTMGAQENLRDLIEKENNDRKLSLMSYELTSEMMKGTALINT